MLTLVDPQCFPDDFAEDRYSGLLASYSHTCTCSCNLLLTFQVNKIGDERIWMACYASLVGYLH